jgi:hypothetical protein
VLSQGIKALKMVALVVAEDNQQPTLEGFQMIKHKRVQNTIEE